ncbi:MAG TPA: FAD:protein FMN transferase [Anseongella sp.]
MSAGILSFLTLLFLLQAMPGCEKQAVELQEVRFNGYAQGTTYHVIYLQGNGTSYQSEMDSLLEEIDSSLSLYLPGSLINRFNEHPRGVRMDNFLREVVEKAYVVSRETGGTFDLTVKPLVDAWGFGEQRHSVVPDSDRIRSLLDLVDFRLLEIKGDSLIKKHPDVRIDANGIAQGYTLDVLAGFLEKKHVRNYLVELGGEIRVRGKNREGRGWRIGVETPPEPSSGTDHDPSSEAASSLARPLTRMISVSDKGVSTSGNYRRFFESGGKHYAHTIDPRSGYPVQNKLISVTVVAPDCITADAWDNALMVMGISDSFEKLRKNGKIEALFIYADENGHLRDTSTAGFHKFYIPED